MSLFCHELTTNNDYGTFYRHVRPSGLLTREPRTSIDNGIICRSDPQEAYVKKDSVSQSIRTFEVLLEDISSLKMFGHEDDCFGECPSFSTCKKDYGWDASSGNPISLPSNKIVNRVTSKLQQLLDNDSSRVRLVFESAKLERERRSEEEYSKWLQDKNAEAAINMQKTVISNADKKEKEKTSNDIPQISLKMFEDEQEKGLKLDGHSLFLLKLKERKLLEEKKLQEKASSKNPLSSNTPKRKAWGSSHQHHQDLKIKSLPNHPQNCKPHSENKFIKNNHTEFQKNNISSDSPPLPFDVLPNSFFNTEKQAHMDQRQLYNNKSAHKIEKTDNMFAVSFKHPEQIQATKHENNAERNTKNIHGALVKEENNFSSSELSYDGQNASNSSRSTYDDRVDELDNYDQYTHVNISENADVFPEMVDDNYVKNTNEKQIEEIKESQLYEPNNDIEDEIAPRAVPTQSFEDSFIEDDFEW